MNTINYKLSNRITKIEGISRIMALLLTFIGMIGFFLTLGIDRIRGGSFNLPSQIGWFQITGEILFLIVTVLGIIFMIALTDGKKNQSNIKN